MKKRFTAILAAVLCMSAPLSVHAVDVDVDVDASFTYVTDTFTYKSENPYGLAGFLLETELVDPDFMVVGYRYGNGREVPADELVGYVITPINDEAFLKNGIAETATYFIELHFGEKPLRIGDLFKVEGEWCVAEPTIYSYVFREDAELTYFGNGVDLLGKDFERVIRLQMVIDQAEYYARGKEFFDIDLIRGDVNVDDAITVLDAISINKNILIGSPLCDYAKLAGDINENSMIDAADSLAILKEIVGLTENFE